MKIFKALHSILANASNDNKGVSWLQFLGSLVVLGVFQMTWTANFARLEQRLYSFVNPPADMMGFIQSVNLQDYDVSHAVPVDISQSGEYLFFISGHDQLPHIFVRKPDGEVVDTQIQAQPHNWDVSADCTKLVMIHPGDPQQGIFDYSVVLFDVASAAMAEIPTVMSFTDLSGPVFSPDGSSIAMVYHVGRINGVYVQNIPDSYPRHFVLRGRAKEGFDVFDIRWSLQESGFLAFAPHLPDGYYRSRFVATDIDLDLEQALSESELEDFTSSRRHLSRQIEGYEDITSLDCTVQPEADL